MQLRMGEGLKTFGAMKMMFTVRGASLIAKMDLHKTVSARTFTYRTEVSRPIRDISYIVRK